MRVLLLAEECNPTFQSNPLVGYNMCKAISEQVEAVVVTQIRNKVQVDANPLRAAKVVYIDTEYIARPLHKMDMFLKLGSSGNALFHAVMEFVFEVEVWKTFGDDLKKGRFDVIHRVTPISAAIPSPLAKWSAPVPFVLGPVNGGLAYPPQFQDRLVREREWLRYLRRLHRFVPYLGSTYKHAAAILAAFPHTIANLPPGNDDRVIDFPENGVDPSRFQSPGKRVQDPAITFLYVGRLVPFKCVDIAIEAFGRSLLLRKQRLVIVGDGPCKAELARLIQARNLSDAVILLGNRPQTEVAARMRESKVFVFPSIRDSGAGALIEAMMSGLPSAVVDYGPMAALIAAECGIKVPLGSHESHITGFKAALECLAENSALRTSMGEASRRRAEGLFRWDRRARKVIEVYRWVLNQQSSKPEFDGSKLETPKWALVLDQPARVAGDPREEILGTSYEHRKFGENAVKGPETGVGASHPATTSPIDPQSPDRIALPAADLNPWLQWTSNRENSGSRNPQNTMLTVSRTQCLSGARPCIAAPSL